MSPSSTECDKTSIRNCTRCRNLRKSCNNIGSCRSPCIEFLPNNSTGYLHILGQLERLDRFLPVAFTILANRRPNYHHRQNATAPCFWKNSNGPLLQSLSICNKTCRGDGSRNRNGSWLETAFYFLSFDITLSAHKTWNRVWFHDSNKSIRLDRSKLKTSDLES
jgi:hypothetical protein